MRTSKEDSDVNRGHLMDLYLSGLWKILDGELIKGARRYNAFHVSCPATPQEEIEGLPGDYVCKGPDGELFVLSAAEFEALPDFK